MRSWCAHGGKNQALDWDAKSERRSNSERPTVIKLKSKVQSSKEAPSSKLKTPKKHQGPSSKTDLRAAPAFVFAGLAFEILNFS
jgi:hypothetical protein